MATDGKSMREEILRELTENILPFWQGRMRDPQGGFFGGADCDGVVDKAAPRAAVVNARFGLVQQLDEVRLGARDGNPVLLGERLQLL